MNFPGVAADPVRGTSAWCRNSALNGACLSGAEQSSENVRSGESGYGNESTLRKVMIKAREFALFDKHRDLRLSQNPQGTEDDPGCQLTAASCLGSFVASERRSGANRMRKWCWNLWYTSSCRRDARILGRSLSTPACLCWFGKTRMASCSVVAGPF